MSALHPHNSKAQLSFEDQSEVTIMRIADRLKKLPHEVRNAPVQDIYHYIDVMNADEEIGRIKRKKQRPKGGKKR